MKTETNAYQEATKSFLKNFDIFWTDTINSIGLDSAQLKIGNRLRPQICFWGYLATVNSYDVATHDYNHVARIAVSIELVHKASLLIDDWIDDDSERHGNPSFHIEYSPQQAVLCALNMIGCAMDRLESAFTGDIVLPHNYYLCLKAVLKTVCSMAKGALEELRLEEAEFFNSEKIREITRLETSEIIGNSLLLGYYAGAGKNVNPEIEKRFKAIGDKCGYLFQAFNDLEAYVSPNKLMEHKGELNFDFQSKRKNLAVATLYELASIRDREVLINSNQATLLKLMKKYKVIDTMRRELKNVYLDLMDSCKMDSTYGISESWVSGFQNFMELVKKFAEDRLR